MMEKEKRTEIPEEKGTKKGEKETLVWCGPTIKHVASQYTVFKHGLPEAMKVFVEKTPAAKGLLVPLEKFAETRLKVSKKGTAEAMLAEKLEAGL